MAARTLGRIICLHRLRYSFSVRALRLTGLLNPAFAFSMYILASMESGLFYNKPSGYGMTRFPASFLADNPQRILWLRYGRL